MQDHYLKTKALLLLNFLMIALSVLIRVMMPSPTQKRILNLTEFTDLMLDKVCIEIPCLPFFITVILLNILFIFFFG